jgi:hypothetical protein
MKLNTRLAKLERTLADQRCTCLNSTDLSWPGHHPHTHCSSCGGERLLCTLKHHPREAEPLLRRVLPLIEKIYINGDRSDLSKLRDHELQQVKEALLALTRCSTGVSLPTSGAL